MREQTEPAFLRATRTAYDTMAERYARRFSGELEKKPLERALLGAFAEQVTAGGGGPVVEVGSGPGRVTAHLAGLGLDVYGVELSPRMVALAREAHPGLRFEEGSMTALDAADGSLAGVVAAYSIIHVPDAGLPGVFAEFARVLAPGGQVLVVFQTGDGEPVHRTEAFGHTVALDYYWRQPEPVAELMEAAGLTVYATTRRQAEEEEMAPRAILLARKRAARP
jgi:SAM-dependent methyltransferase